MKRIAALLLTVCVFFSLTAAQAAPTRDMGRVEAEITPGMRLLTETVLGAAVFTGARGLEEGMAPSPALAEAAIALGLYNLSLPHDGGDLLDNVAEIGGGEAGALCGLLFTAGTYTLPAAASVSGVTRTADGLRVDLRALQDAPMIGAYIHAVRVEDGDAENGTVELEADLYSYYGDFSTDAQDVPEDALTWLCGAEIALDVAPETPYGYRVKRFALTDRFEDGMLADWQAAENAVCEYSLNVPSILGLASDDPYHMVWQAADGSTSLRIDTESLGGRSAAQALADYQAAHPQTQIVWEEEYCRYYAVEEGEYHLWLISPDLPDLYHVSLVFPREKQAEYTLYCEFIRNSLIAWGISNG